MHCKRFRPQPLSRRDLLKGSGIGFGAFALDALLMRNASASNGKGMIGTHHEVKAKSIIFLYMDGGVSHVDSFDPKPLLKEHNGKDPSKFFKVAPTQFNNNGKILASPWGFKKYGKSGIPISDLFPNIAKHADKLAVVRSMTSKFSEHTNANYFLHTGSGVQGRPSMGSWVTYGLGSESEDLPGFVVVNGGLTPPGGLDNFNSGFLPAAYQGSVFKPQASPVANINRRESDLKHQQKKLNLVAKLDKGISNLTGGQDAIESAIKNYEMAFRMQNSVPELADLSNESDSMKEMYGMNHKYDKTRIFASECLMARRLVERGVRFIELTCPNCGHDRWDAHGNLKRNHEDNSRAVDQPIAALLEDLEQRGMLKETLVVWAGEFGRTPFAQGSNGRDHHPFAYSLWMAGGGIKGGTVYGKTDEFGYHVIEGKAEIHDLHATMLHLLGVDHERSTYRFSGRDMRLTDVHGHVLHDIIS
ncbi:MAG: DUF1501 domain-containing protein [Verrucomicrobiota bacterium]|nr:sulfatase [Verrucomicrobiales bacterium]MEC9035655.1 DUF1501 domain-containing protein [Verrucomicrobiota bacterium]MED5471969.1 DUF1501 domain-containing protein [Verrucomicrobiota bacterium]MEE2967818.1 DUF1501 domain-containing protein [Verrucomicrobiota bacterium]